MTAECPPGWTLYPHAAMYAPLMKPCPICEPKEKKGGRDE